MSTQHIPDNLTEEEEIILRESWRNWERIQAERDAYNEERRHPAIGYGALFEDSHDFTLSVDLSFPGEDCSSAFELEALVDQTVKFWLVTHAPKGTRTTLVSVDVTD